MMVCMLEIAVRMNRKHTPKHQRKSLLSELVRKIVKYRARGSFAIVATAVWVSMISEGQVSSNYLSDFNQLENLAMLVTGDCSDSVS